MAKKFVSRGSVQKKGNQYYAVISYRDTMGKRKRKWVAAGPDLKKAKEKLTAELAAQDNGLFVTPGKETLEGFLKHWIDIVEGTLSPRTIEGYQTIIKRVNPQIGRKQLHKIGTVDLQGYLTFLQGEDGHFKGKGGLSPLTVIHHARLLHRAFRDAVKWGLLPRNPANDLVVPKAEGKEIKFMSEKEIHDFLEAAKETDYYDIFHCFIYTGARRSEMLALRWSDFDQEHCSLSISRTLHQLHDTSFVFRQTKSAKGKRIVTLPQSTVEVLKHHKEKMFAQRLEFNKVLSDNDLVFSLYDGSPIRPDTVSRAWTILAKKMGIAASNLHSSRHTHASILLKLGIPAKVVQERLGHSTISITLDIYSHIMPGLQEEAAKRFDDALRLM